MYRNKIRHSLLANRPIKIFFLKKNSSLTIFLYMFLIFVVVVLGKKNNYFKSVKNRDNPREVSNDEITYLKSLMTDQTGAYFKVVISGKLF